MELIDEILSFLHRYKSKLIILFIIFILLIYSIISMDMYLIIVTVEIFLIYIIEIISEAVGHPLLGEKKLLELFISTILFIIIFIVSYPLLDSNIDNNIYRLFVILYINWFFFTNVIINYSLKNDLGHQQTLYTQ